MTIGGNTIALADIESIQVMRYPMGEFGRLRAGRRTVQLYRIVDFPLLCEHILRRCPGVSFTFDVRRPRSVAEQVFLPCPPGSEGLWSDGN